MTTAATIAALQTINRAITGVTRAFDGATYPIPGAINAADLPCVVLFPGTLDLFAAARSVPDSTQIYSGIALVAGQAQGTGINDTVNAVWTLWDAFKARYNTLIGTPEILSTGESVLTFHSEAQQAITFRGATWEGFAFRIEVFEI